jgi:hypothetical protein
MGTIKALFAFSKLAFSTYKLYFLLGSVLLLVGGTGYLVWSYKSAMAEREVQQAVNDTNREAQKRIDRAEAQTAIYRDLADQKYDLLVDRLTNLKIQRVEITNNIREEINVNREFYDQPLTPKGWAQWLKARKTYEDTSGITK